jgi:dynein heavy chain
MNLLFEKGKLNPPISKNMPPKAGAIAWARSIMGRIKTPIYKFKAKQEMLLTPNGKKATKNYIDLAKKLDVSYEKEIFNKWIKENTE